MEISGYALTVKKQKSLQTILHLSLSLMKVSNDSEIDEVLNRDFRLNVPIRPISSREITREIKSSDLHKAPGFDLITTFILKQLPNKVIVLNLFNVIMRTSYFPTLWKISEIIMIHMAGKSEHQARSRRIGQLVLLQSSLSYGRGYFSLGSRILSITNLSSHFTNLVFVSRIPQFNKFTVSTNT